MVVRHKLQLRCSQKGDVDKSTMDANNPVGVQIITTYHG